MKKRLSAILLACGLSVSMLSGTAFAADSQTEAAGEAAAVEEAATEAAAEESELADEAGGTAAEETSAAAPRKVEGAGKYEQRYTMIESSIEQTLSQLSALTDDQIAQALEQPDSDNTRLIASWDQARESCGEYEGVEYYDVREDGTDITFTDVVNYKKAAEEKATVTVTVAFDMKNQTTSYSWNVKETVGKALAEAGENTVAGLVNVFFVLFILTFVISLFRYIPNGSRKKKELEAAEAAAPAETAAAVPAEEEVSDDDEIAAVIAAAVAAYESENGPAHTDGFVVRSIRRRTRRSNWQNA